MGWGHLGYDETDAMLDLMAEEMRHERRMREIRELNIQRWVHEVL